MAMENVDRDIPLQRRWLSSDSKQTRNGDDSFTVITYNILADGFTPDYYFPYCPREYFKAFQRFPQLLRQLDHHNADIICLQEVDDELYPRQLEPMLRNRGYQGIFKTSVRRVGLAMFFRRSRFELVQEKHTDSIELIEKGLSSYKDIDAHAISQADVKTEPKPILFCKFRCRRSGKHVTIGTHHFIFNNYKSLDVSTMQTSLAMRHLLQLSGGTDHPHILCGDMNQEPGLPAYQLMETVFLTESDKDVLREYNTKKDSCLVDQFPDVFSHQSKHMKSAYKEIAGFEAPFSNHEDYRGTNVFPAPLIPENVDKNEDDGPTKPTKRAKTDQAAPMIYRSKPENYGKEVFIATLDYFWYSSNKLQCDGVLEMIDASVIEKFHSAPNIVFPSDHMLMKAEFHFL